VNNVSTISTAKTFPTNIAIVGNPNCGKTTLFNALTGLKQKVGNYPGVTVEKKKAKFHSAEMKLLFLTFLEHTALSRVHPMKKLQRIYFLAKMS